ILAGALVLTDEQSFQLFLQIRGATVLFSGLEGVHGRAVIFSEGSRELGGCSGEVESVSIFGEGNVLLWHSRSGKSLEHVVFDTPRHRADEALRWGRRVGGTNLENLRHQRGVAGNPVSHDNPATGPGYAHYLLSHIEGLWRKHGAEDTHDEVK